MGQAGTERLSPTAKARSWLRTSTEAALGDKGLLKPCSQLPTAVYAIAVTGWAKLGLSQVSQYPESERKRQTKKR